jgi:deoxyribose-phosphate aldolase
MDTLFDRLSYRQVAKSIDHSLLRPELDDAAIEEGCRLALDYDVAAVTCRPCDVARVAALLRGSVVAVDAVVGFPHGSHRRETKLFEAHQALVDGATELDMVINIGALRSGRDADVQAEIAEVVAAAHAQNSIVKVILENAYLDDDEKVRGCRAAEAAGAEFVKTSTGFAPGGATHDDLLLMRRSVSPRVGVKAAGGVRSLDALLAVLELGVTRVGATQTKTILDEFRERKRAMGAPVAGAGEG